jgi:GDP-4-dehydro-6-deoxy-D-mannose reductase
LRLLITGANGFLGRRLTAALLAAGDEPVALSLERGVLPEEVPFVAADLADLETLERVVGEHQPEAIVHLAALSHVGESWDRIAEYWAVNVVGTDHVLTAAAGRPVLFSSSAEVYGAVPDDQQPIDERRPPAPRSPYALTKAVGERAAIAAGAVVVRCFNLLGAGQTPSCALPGFARQLAAIATGEREPVLAVGNLEAQRDFVHVDDAVDGLRTLLREGEAGSIYNLASGASISIRDALERLIAIAGVAARSEIDPTRVRPLDIPLLCGDASRLRALGWRPRRGIEDALTELWREAFAAS